MSLIHLAAAAMVCAALASCTRPPNGSPEPGPDGPGAIDNGSPEPGWDLSGVVAAVQPGNGTTRVAVDVARPGAPGERVILLVSSGTEITVQRAEGTSRPGDVRDLVPGTRVGARHTGAQLRSLPPQYPATHLRVLAGP